VKTWPAIVTVPVRDPPVVFVVAPTITVPLPVPDWPDTTLSQGSLLAAVQLQTLVVRTRTFDVVADPPVEMLNGDREYAHVPACEIWRSFPPIAIVPLRANSPVFDWTAKPMVPGPVPVPPDVMEIHGCEGFAVQLHPLAISTSTVNPPPAAPTDVLLGLNVATQDRPLWLTPKVCPPMVIEPVRIVVSGLTAIV
jgi:hypothetical protein